MKNEVWIILAVSVMGILICMGIIAIVRAGRKRRTGFIDDMEGHEFEYFCAELLKDNGFTEVEVTKGSGDYGIDVLAEKEGVTYEIGRAHV